MSPFGKGLSAAAGLRERILERLGAKDEAEADWVRDSDTLDLVAWMSGPVATFFRVGEAAEHTPDLGFLRVVTPVTMIDDLDAALETCDRLNQVATTSRWTIENDGLGADTLAIGCGFVVGPHNAGTLEEFVLWCVREQISVASTVADGIMAAWTHPGPESDDMDTEVNTELYGWGPYPGMDVRPSSDAHEVTLHYERRIAPARDALSDPLADALHDAFIALRRQMREEGSAEWGRWKDAPGLTIETPMAWEPYRDGRVSQEASGGMPTALVIASVDDHPRVGNGLRISMQVPWSPVADARAALVEMNHLDLKVRGSTHSVGGWSLEPCPTEENPEEHGYVYTVYLPAALADPSLGLDLPAVMRELLLTMSRQALLFRRMLHPDLRAWEDERPCVGLAATHRHGLAWGETGEGRDRGTTMLNRLYTRFVGDGTDWADTRPGGFTWWPYQQAQSITLDAPEEKDPLEATPANPVLRISTEVSVGVPRTPDTWTRIARLNAELGRSALRLIPDDGGDDTSEGRLVIECHLSLDSDSRWLYHWAEYLAVDQYSTARDLVARLDGLGTPAVSAHPFAGPRPDDGELLGLRDALYVPLAQGARPALTPLAPLLATAGQVVLPYRITDNDDGGLEFTWYPSQSEVEVPVDPAVRVSIRPGDTGAGPGWIVRSHVAVTGTAAAKARWCAERNQALLDTPALYVTGGWGLSAEDECCLTTWLPPFLFTAEANHVRFLIDVYRDHQTAVLSALVGAPEAVVTVGPLTPDDLAAGLRQTLDTFGRILDYPADHSWTVAASDVGAVVAADTAAIQVPVIQDRSELGLLYAVFLGRSETRVQTRHAYDLVPGEVEEWSFTCDQVDRMIYRLNTEGLVDWPENETVGSFQAGEARGRLSVRYLDSDRLYGAAPLRIAAVVDGGPGTLPDGDAAGPDVLGTWRHHAEGLAYEVILPPAGLIWIVDREAAATLVWAARHVIHHVRAALQQPTQNS